MEKLNNLDVVYKGKLGKRRCYRVHYKGLKLEVYFNEKKKEIFEVKDINTYGVAFYAGKYKEKFNTGDIILVSIILKKHYILKGIKALIKRIITQNNAIVCCEFIELNRKQEYTLDKLCLTIQKILIRLQKKEKK